MPEMVRLLALMERSLADESSCNVGQILPLPQDGQDNTIKQLMEDLGRMRGNIVTVETTKGGQGLGQYAAPTKDWESNRIGPEYNGNAAEIMRLAQMTVMATLGVPIELVTSSDGTGQREGVASLPSQHAGTYGPYRRAPTI